MLALIFLLLLEILIDLPFGISEFNFSKINHLIVDTSEVMKILPRDFPGSPMVRTPVLFTAKGSGSSPCLESKIPKATGWGHKKKKKTKYHLDSQIVWI